MPIVIYCMVFLSIDGSAIMGSPTIKSSPMFMITAVSSIQVAKCVQSCTWRPCRRRGTRAQRRKPPSGAPSKPSSPSWRLQKGLARQPPKRVNKPTRTPAGCAPTWRRSAARGTSCRRRSAPCKPNSPGVCLKESERLLWLTHNRARKLTPQPQHPSSE